MMHDLDIPPDGVCPDCGYASGHNVESCPRVLEGRSKKMAGLPPETVERLRREGHWSERC
jgi:hypothetical protein